jgi:hypothetical protein
MRPGAPFGFGGHDGAMEASFFVTEDALRKLTPNMKFDEDRILSAFDLNRNLIYATAARVYGRARNMSCKQPTFDFWERDSTCFRPSSAGVASEHARECPLWVKTRHDALKSQCPLYSQKRTSPGDS